MEIKFGKLWISVTMARFDSNKDTLKSETSLNMFNTHSPKVPEVVP